MLRILRSLAGDGIEAPPKTCLAVDRAEGLRKFCREHIELLTSRRASPEIVKKLRQEFFTRNNTKPFERFKSTDVAREVASVLARRRDVSEATFRENIASIPFLREELVESELEFVWTREHPIEPILRADDLGKLRHEDHLKRIEGAFEEKARAQAESKLQTERVELAIKEAEVERRATELARFKSELDSMAPELSLEQLREQVEEPKELGATKSSLTWWEEVGLTGDPFPSNRGLTGIDTKKVEQVVVRTPFYDFYVDALRQAPERLLGKTILVSGEFGSGKTTLFEYLTATAGASRVLPITIILTPHPSVSSLVTTMLQRFVGTLAETYAAGHKEDVRKYGRGDDLYTEALTLLKELQRDGATTGFLVFVDGLHKGTAYTEPVFEFLQQIQTVQEFFEQGDIRVGFIVAGSPLWEKEMTLRPSLSGSFYRRDRIPPLTEDAAVDAVERRIQTYSAEGTPRVRIRRDSLRQAFRLLSQRLPRGLTFRDFLDHIRGRLEAKQYEEAGLLVTLHLETVEAVHRGLLRSSIGDAYKGLLQGLAGEPILRTGCKRVVRAILFRSGVPETSIVFRDNKGVFFLLKKQGLIVQRSDPETTFKWHLSPGLVEAIQGISQSLGIEPEAILQAALEEESVVREAEARSIYGSALEVLAELSAAWKDSWEFVAQRIDATRQVLADVDRKSSAGQYSSLSPLDFRVSIDNLVAAVVYVVYADESDSNPWERLRQSWTSPENLDTIEKVGTVTALPTQQTAVLGFLHEHSQAILQLVHLLEELIIGESISRLRGRQLSADECITVHTLRLAFLRQDFPVVVAGTSELVERRIRECIFPALRAVWGTQAKLRLPADVRETIDKVSSRGHPRARREGDVNFLYDVTRGQYSKILFESSIHKALNEDPVDSAAKERFKDTIELTFSLNDRLAHRDRSAYFRDHATEVGDVLKALPRVLELVRAVTDKVLVQGNFEFEKLSDGGLIATFFPDVLPPPQPIKISKKDAIVSSKAILDNLAARDLVVETLSSPLLVGHLTPESQLALLRILHKHGFVETQRAAFRPLTFRITDRGKAELNSFASPPTQRRIEDSAGAQGEPVPPKQE